MKKLHLIRDYENAKLLDHPHVVALKTLNAKFQLSISKEGKIMVKKEGHRVKVAKNIEYNLFLFLLGLIAKIIPSFIYLNKSVSLVFNLLSKFLLL